MDYTQKKTVYLKKNKGIWIEFLNKTLFKSRVREIFHSTINSGLNKIKYPSRKIYTYKNHSLSIMVEIVKNARIWNTLNFVLSKGASDRNCSNFGREGE